MLLTCLLISPVFAPLISHALASEDGTGLIRSALVLLGDSKEERATTLCSLVLYKMANLASLQVRKNEKQKKAMFKSLVQGIEDLPVSGTFILDENYSRRESVDRLRRQSQCVTIVTRPQSVSRDMSGKKESCQKMS